MGTVHAVSSVRRLVLVGLVVALVATAALASAAGPPAVAGEHGLGGPIILMGLDSEDSPGSDTHGPPEDHQAMVASLLDSVRNDGDGILVIGDSSSIRSYWKGDVADPLAVNVDFVSGAQDIESVDFDGYAMIGVASSDHEISRGLTQDENDALNGREHDIAAFVNNGGGLLGKTQDGFADPFGYVGPLGEFTVQSTSFSSIEVTPAGLDLGLTQDGMDGWCCYHEVFDTFPDFMEVLITHDDGGSSHGKPAAIGGVDVVIPTEVEIDLDGPQEAETDSPEEYDIGVANVGDTDEDVQIHYRVTHESGIEDGDAQFEYRDGGGTWQDLVMDVDSESMTATTGRPFGPEAGFEIQSGDAQTETVRATFTVPETFTVSAQVVSDDGETSFDTAGLTIVVTEAEQDDPPRPRPQPGSIEGTVIDAETGDAIEGARVEVVGPEEGDATTDADGDYAVEELESGDYTVTASADGYTENSTEVGVEDDETTTADLELEPIEDEPVDPGEEDDPADPGEEDDPADPAEEDQPISERFGGVDRFDTAARLSAESFDPGVSVAYIATGLEFADALTGGVAAALDEAPVLLVSHEIPSVTETELERLEAQRLVVLGGTAAVSAEIEDELANFTEGSVERLGGAHRFGTAAEVSQELFPTGVDTAYVATGLEFADALSGVPPAAGAPGPLLLTVSDSLPAETVDELERLQPERIVLLGGDAAVAPDVADELAAYGAVARVAGLDRFGTAAEIAASEFPHAEAVDTVYAATGSGFADALTSGAIAGAEGAPVLLVADGPVPRATAEQLQRLRPDRLVIVGGTEAVSDAVAEELEGYIAR